MDAPPASPPGQRSPGPFATAAEIERWDREWLNYLLQEYPQQLRPYTTYPDRPALPEDPIQMLDVSMGAWSRMLLYASGSSIRDKNVLEFGCGCGNLGKLVACYARTYLGIDFSPLALSIARLVSPPNAVYLHPNQAEELDGFAGTVDTLVSRFFWIHQNFATGRRVLNAVEPLLKPGALVYFDFFWPNPGEAVGFWQTVDRVRSPDGPLDDEPSAMYAYSRADVDRLLQGLPFRVLSQQEYGPNQRRYVRAQKI